MDAGGPLQAHPLPEFFQFGQLVIPGQRVAFPMLQFLPLRHGQRFSPHNPGAVMLVVFKEYRPAGALGIIGQEVPVAVTPGQVDRRMAPGLRGPGGGRPTSLQVGVVGGGQAQVGEPLLAAFQHPVECGQVLAVLDGVLGPLEDLFDRVIRQ